jgi:hypothetical protein
MLEFKWWRSNKITCHIHRYQKTNYLGEQAHYFCNLISVLLAEFLFLIVFIQFFGIYFFTILNSAIQLDLNFNFPRMNLIDKVCVESKISLTYIKSHYIETSYLSNKMLYNSLPFNKIESSIGVDKWVKVIDIQEKPFMKPLCKLIFSYFEENKLKIFKILQSNSI